MTIDLGWCGSKVKKNRWVQIFKVSKKWSWLRLGKKKFWIFLFKKYIGSQWAKGSNFQPFIGPICLLIWADVHHKRRIRGESSFLKSQKLRQQRLRNKKKIFYLLKVSKRLHFLILYSPNMYFDLGWCGSWLPDQGPIL